jgi:hypothetical protein
MLENTDDWGEKIPILSKFSLNIINKVDAMVLVHKC